jgi:hypothetical protein
MTGKVIRGRALIVLSAVVLVGSAAAVADAGADRAGGAAPQSSSATCRAGSRRAVIGGKVKCLRVGQACAARYQAAYRKYGFACVKGHLRKRAAPKPTPPPAPPPPPAQPGHYQGTTSQNEVFQFDVTASGDRVQNFTTGQINEGCNPPAHLSGGNFSGGSGPIAADGSFKFDFDYTSTVSGVPSKGHFTLTGRFSGAAATGTLSDTTTFTYGGVAYSCGSGQQTWTATKSG